MKKKGFTLVELLAVIVILAIIALITIPMITGVVGKVRKGAAESSAYGYIDAVEKYVMLDNTSGNNTVNLNGIYQVDRLSELGVKVKGKKPSSGNVELEKGYIASATLCIDNYKIVIENDKVKKTIKENNCSIDLAPGLYDGQGNFLSSFNYLNETYHLNVEKDYDDKTEFKDNGESGNSLGYVLNTYYKDYDSLMIVFPDDIEKLGKFSTFKIENLVSVKLNNNLKEIGTASFNNSNIKTITIPSSVEKIEKDVFGTCKNLENIFVAKGNKNYVSVDGVLFSNDMKELIEYPSVKKEETYNVPDSVVKLDYAAFSYNDYLVNVDTNKVSTIEFSAFYNCRNLKNVVLSKNIEKLETFTFGNCINLEDIFIPNNIVYIVGGTFSGCTNLKKVTFENQNNWYEYSKPIIVNYSDPPKALDVSNPEANAEKFKKFSLADYYREVN